MAHPFAGHKQNAVGKRRANKLMHGNEYARGGRAEGGKTPKLAEAETVVLQPVSPYEHYNVGVWRGTKNKPITPMNWKPALKGDKRGGRV